MILNEYETTYIVRPDVTEDILTRLKSKYEGVINEHKGTILVSEDWGKRKLAYLIKKHARGQFVYLNYCAPASMEQEMERILGLEDDLLRFLTVRIERNVVIDERRALAEERKRVRMERMAAQKAEEEAEARYRAEAEEAEEELAVEADE